MGYVIPSVPFWCITMTAPREPLYRWRFPRNELLEGRIFPKDNPPFGPFPTVTDILNANLCPRALYHSLFHGFDNSLSAYSFDGINRGNIFHKLWVNNYQEANSKIMKGGTKCSQENNS